MRAIEIAVYQEKHKHLSKPYPDISAKVFGIDCSREVRRKRISERLIKRVDEGLIPEVENLLAEGVDHDDLEFYGLEYKYVSEYLRGMYDRKEFFRKLEIAIHQFAKRQMTFFRSMEKKGVKIQWLSREMSNEEMVEEMSLLILKKQ